MQDHHRRAAEKAVARLREEPDVRLVLLAGSIAKGQERADSDVDLIAVTTDEGYAERLDRGAAAFLWTDLADWAGGYVEGRYLSRGFVLAAAERGSEPTRWSFTGVSPLWGEDAEVLQALPCIPRYPEETREKRLDAFFAQLTLCHHYFWKEGVRRCDPYLKAWAQVQIVLFAGRLVLAHDRVLFPNQKRLMEALATCPSKPPNFEWLAERVLAGDLPAGEELYGAIRTLIGPREADLISRFEQDVEMSWFTGAHDVAEW